MVKRLSSAFLILACFMFGTGDLRAQQTVRVPSRDEIVGEFQARMEHVKNLYFIVESKTAVYKDANGELGALVEELPLEVYEYWQFNDSNRQDTILINPDKTLNRFASSFDADRGQGVTRSATADRSFGYIDSNRDPLMCNNRYRFWLNVRDWGLGSSEYLFNYVIDHKDTLQVERDSETGSFKITTDYAPHWISEASGGKRVLWLDPQKRLLPIRGLFEWKNDNMSRIERIDIVDSVVVGTFWMPTVIKEHITVTLPGQEPIHNVHVTRVKKIEQGKVSATDLEINFPVNTKFVDAIKGVHFLGDENGNPIGKVEPVMQDRILRTDRTPR